MEDNMEIFHQSEEQILSYNPGIQILEIYPKEIKSAFKMLIWGQAQ